MKDKKKAAFGKVTETGKKPKEEVMIKVSKGKLNAKEIKSKRR
jgi:hypothetical protein